MKNNAATIGKAGQAGKPDAVFESGGIAIPAAFQLPAPSYAKPEFIRLPKPGTSCPWTGLTRGTLNNLILPGPANGFKPPVKSVSLRPRGAKRGCRLIVFDSLLGYLHSREEACA
jgi:hypothetical protein